MNIHSAAFARKRITINAPTRFAGAKQCNVSKAFMAKHPPSRVSTAIEQLFNVSQRPNAPKNWRFTMLNLANLLGTSTDQLSRLLAHPNYTEVKTNWDEKAAARDGGRSTTVKASKPDKKAPLSNEKPVTEWATFISGLVQDRQKPGATGSFNWVSVCALIKGAHTKETLPQMRARGLAALKTPAEQQTLSAAFDALQSVLSSRRALGRSFDGQRISPAVQKK